jgi:hypothetical protein
MTDMVAGHLGEGPVEHHEPVGRDIEGMPGFGAKEIRVVIRPKEGADPREPDRDKGPVHEELRFELSDGDQGVWDVEERIRRLRAQARDAEEAGKHDKASAISEEARDLEKFLRNMWEPKDEEAPPARRLREERDEVGVLREEVRNLRRDVDRLTDALRRKIGDF